MSKEKIHKPITVDGTPFGPGECTFNLCGREGQGDEDGPNASEYDEEVTCKICLKIMNDPSHWKHYKYLREDIINIRDHGDITKPECRFEVTCMDVTLDNYLFEGYGPTEKDALNDFINRLTRIKDSMDKAINEASR